MMNSYSGDSSELHLQYLNSIDWDSLLINVEVSLICNEEYNSPKNITTWKLAEARDDSWRAWTKDQFEKRKEIMASPSFRKIQVRSLQDMAISVLDDMPCISDRQVRDTIVNSKKQIGIIGSCRELPKTTLIDGCVYVFIDRPLGKNSDICTEGLYNSLNDLGHVSLLREKVNLVTLINKDSDKKTYFVEDVMMIFNHIVIRMMEAL